MVYAPYRTGHDKGTCGCRRQMKRVSIADWSMKPCRGVPWRVLVSLLQIESRVIATSPVFIHPRAYLFLNFTLNSLGTTISSRNLGISDA